MYSLRRGVPGGAKSATALRIAGKITNGEF